MENAGETVDDQGSGWFLVKKKHRSSSKFSSVQSWVGSFSGKAVSSNNRHRQSCSSEKVGNLHGKRRSQPPKTGAVKGHSTSTGSFAVSSKEKVVLYDDKRVLEKDTDCRQSAQSHSVNSSDQVDITIPPSLEVRHDVTQKIMWGDLEDEIEVPHHERNVRADIMFGNIGNDSYAISPVSGLGNESSVNHHIEGTSTDNADACQVPTSMSNNLEKFREVTVLSVEDTEEKIFGPCNDASVFKNESSGYTETVNIIEEVVTMENVAALSEMDDAQVTQDPDTSGCSDKTSAVKDTGVSRNAMTSDGIPKHQNFNASAEEGGSSEGKERFRQRLWCFLFENLNRAVDELYLLCELECDVEQMKEAVLVLEEAAFDFKELTSRVEKFENSKRSCSLLKDGMPITLKTDNRRPHALSWEVRRMTTSPHKAEILSSSIEAFRKIQEERASICRVDDTICLGSGCSKCHQSPGLKGVPDGKSEADKIPGAKESSTRLKKRSGHQDLVQTKQKVNQGQNGQNSSPKLCSSDVASAPQPRDTATARRSIKEQNVEKEKHVRKDKMLTEGPVEKHSRCAEQLKRHQNALSEKEKEKRTTNLWKCLDAWKEKRNWEDILTSPFRVSSRISHSPGLSRKSAERARVLHDKLMSPEKKKKTAVDLKRDAEEKHARAMRIRSELETEKMQKLQRTSEKLNRVNEWQAVRNMKLREGMYARHQRSESRHEAYLAQVARRAGDESSKVNEVRFITSLNEENKKLILRQKLHGSEMRRAEKLQFLKIKQKEDSAREEAVLERRKTIEAEKLQRLVETQRKKEEAQVRREEERRASSAAREARAMEQLRRKEVRAKAQQEEAELLAQKLVEKLSESEQRRKFYLEQIRERASMDFREQSSPSLRRPPTNKETQGRSTSTSVSEEVGNGVNSAGGGSALASGSGELQHSVKRRVKKIRQRLMALKHDFPEPLVGAENTSIGYRTAVGSARAKIGRWLQELQRLRQERKEGAAGIGLIAADMTKFLEGKEPELQASRQAGLLDFIASALPASHISKPEACQVTINLLRLLRVVLSLPPNRSYFLSQNLLPPIIPMMSAALENYIKIAASLNIAGINNVVSSKASVENFDSISEVLDGLLWTVTKIIGFGSSDERQLQMREGLTELLIAYQVIHRLRDLFALYDRPQVEGSPFPSSIVFSIQLLVVLTTRPETNNVIDWDLVPVVNKLMFENEEVKLSDSAHSIAENSSGDQKKLVQGFGQTVSLPGKSDDSPLGESNNTSESVDASVQLKDNNVATRNGLDAACNILGEGTSKSPSQKGCRCSDDIVAEKKEGSTLTLKQPIMSLVSAISETGLVCLPSLLTSVLLQANNRLSAEQASYVLPLNFEEVATGVLKLLNNLAYIDITFMQKLLARPDLKMEFFHLMGFLLSHCNAKWKSHHDQVGLLLLESLLLLSHFALFHPENQAVLRWGNSPTILHKVCDLPFVFFSDPELMPVLAGALVAACYGSEQNRGVVQQELSVDMLLSLLKSCRNVSPPNSLRCVSVPTTMNNLLLHSSSSNEVVYEYNKRSVKSVRGSVRNLRSSLLKGLSGGNSSRPPGGKKDKVRKVCEEAVPGFSDNLGRSTSALMLHHRFPSSFIDRAEKFFSEGVE